MTADSRPAGLPTSSKRAIVRCLWCVVAVAFLSVAACGNGGSAGPTTSASADLVPYATSSVASPPSTTSTVSATSPQVEPVVASQDRRRIDCLKGLLPREFVSMRDARYSFVVGLAQLKSGIATTNKCLPTFADSKAVSSTTETCSRMKLVSSKTIEICSFDFALTSSGTSLDDDESADLRALLAYVTSATIQETERILAQYSIAPPRCAGVRTSPLIEDRGNGQWSVSICPGP